MGEWQFCLRKYSSVSEDPYILNKFLSSLEKTNIETAPIEELCAGSKLLGILLKDGIERFDQKKAYRVSQKGIEHLSVKDDLSTSESYFLAIMHGTAAELSMREACGKDKNKWLRRSISHVGYVIDNAHSETYISHRCYNLGELIQQFAPSMNGTKESYYGDAYEFYMLSAFFGEKENSPITPHVYTSLLKAAGVANEAYSASKNPIWQHLYIWTNLSLAKKQNIPRKRDATLALATKKAIDGYLEYEDTSFLHSIQQIHTLAEALGSNEDTVYRLNAIAELELAECSPYSPELCQVTFGKDFTEATLKSTPRY